MLHIIVRLLFVKSSVLCRKGHFFPQVTGRIFALILPELRGALPTGFCFFQSNHPFSAIRKEYILELLFSVCTTIPSIDKGRHGFDGQKCAHTASRPLEIRQVFPAGLSLPEHISARQNCFAPASDGFSSDFWLLIRRRAGARQGEKGKKRRKGMLAGVFALVNRWYKS
ncbi:hypothetical protein [Vescimonas sp.]|uniref:hypothetical protein n=1 Tax=Vescimonas sp. TaxID=2892404 RepID=UPI00307CC5A7